MIHSMAGGELNVHNKFDYVKVKILESESADSVMWFISTYSALKVGDKVLVPIGYTQVKGEVVRIDKAVDEYSFPIPRKRLKEIIKILQEWGGDEQEYLL